MALRRGESGNWFGLLMDVLKERLVLDEEGKVDVINLKSRPSTVKELKKRPGFLPAYHMDKRHWISILLDGSVSKSDTTRLLDESHALVK